MGTLTVGFTGNADATAVHAEVTYGLAISWGTVDGNWQIGISPFQTTSATGIGGVGVFGGFVASYSSSPA